VTIHKEITAWRKPYYVEYERGKYSKARAWGRAKGRPPIVKMDGSPLLYIPCDEPKYTGYRKAHTDTHWRWEVVDWQPFEDSQKGQAMLREFKTQLAHRLLGWMISK